MGDSASWPGRIRLEEDLPSPGNRYYFAGKQFDAVRLALASSSGPYHFGLTDIIVASITAIVVSPDTTSPSQTVSVRPVFFTLPRAMNRSPRAGLTKLILNSAVSTSVPSG